METIAILSNCNLKQKADIAKYLAGIDRPGADGPEIFDGEKKDLERFKEHLKIFRSRGGSRTTPTTCGDGLANRPKRLQMKYDSERHNRRSIRLMDYDYSQSGAYFVTICTRDRACVLGEISDGQPLPNELGEIVAETWRWLERHYEYVELDEWLVMPNHLHGIILMRDASSRGASGSALIAGGS